MCTMADRAAAGSKAAGWEHFAHDADVGLRGVGPSREVAFEQGALALVHAIGDADRIEPRVTVEIVCEAIGVSSLAYGTCAASAESLKSMCFLSR